MSTPYNPANRTDHCGFCAIAHALNLQQRTTVDANQLYLDTMARLGLTRDGGRDPIPRRLIFPDWRLPEGVPANAYGVLTGSLRLGDHTITSVAEHFDLRFTFNKSDVVLPNQFLAYQSDKGNRGNIKDFVAERRLDFLESKGPSPRADAMVRNVSDTLVGNSIIGSLDAKHFIRARIDPNGHIIGYDPQDGNRYDASGLKAKTGTVALFMRLR